MRRIGAPLIPAQTILVGLAGYAIAYTGRFNPGWAGESNLFFILAVAASTFGLAVGIIAWTAISKALDTMGD